MGNKITIDCATMVNKSFEIIEAHYLFNYPYNKIGIKLHDESYVHSYVIYKDGTMRLDVGKPDMRNPIKFALYEGKNKPKQLIKEDGRYILRSCNEDKETYPDIYPEDLQIQGVAVCVTHKLK